MGRKNAAVPGGDGIRGCGAVFTGVRRIVATVDKRGRSRCGWAQMWFRYSRRAELGVRLRDSVDNCLL
jgi:hypothetical protein